MDSSLRWNDTSLSGYHVEHIDYSFVILVYARIHYPCHSGLDPESTLEQRFRLWIPAYAGMTNQLQLECNVTSSVALLGVVYREAIWSEDILILVYYSNLRQNPLYLSFRT